VPKGKPKYSFGFGEDSARVRVEVIGLINPTPPSFEREIIPILTKARWQTPEAAMVRRRAKTGSS